MLFGKFSTFINNNLYNFGVTKTKILYSENSDPYRVHVSPVPVPNRPQPSPRVPNRF
jgi:hypothetical protein